MMQAAVYGRISQDSAGKGLGVARQRGDCVALAQRKGWRVAGVYVDNDVSAFSGKRRPQYERMVADLKTGAVDAVIAWHPDRLHRTPRELEDFIALVEASGAAVATCTAGDYDLSHADGRAMARIACAIARKESEDKSRRLRRKHLELAEAGMVAGGGSRPFGFENDRITHRSAEADLLRLAAGRVLAGESLYAIVQEWKRDQVPTVTGAPWSTTALKTCLTSPRVAGKRQHKGVPYDAVWEPILDQDTWRQVTAVLTDPARRRNPVVRRYLLTGMLYCALCGTRLVAAPRSNRQRGYGCLKTHGGCGGVHCLADPVEQLVTDAVLTALDGPALAQLIAARDDGGKAAAIQAVAAAEARLAELTDLFADGEITRGEWLRARERVEDRLEGSRKTLAHRDAPDILSNLLDAPGGLRDAWDGLTLDRRRAVIKTVLEGVTLDRASGVRNRFNPDRIDLRWRV